MTEDINSALLLGKNTPLVETYSPQLLYPIGRSEAREALGLSLPLPFYGADLWHAYELSWLNEQGKPIARVGRFKVPADSSHIVESKSFKLYLNSLNNTRFESEAAAQALIEADVSKVAGATISLALHKVDDPALAGASVGGVCLDELEITTCAGQPHPDMLSVGDSTGEDEVHSHLLRSLCPVTGQPDWATLWIHYRGQSIERQSLLQYIIAYREHQEFHEQCVERMFTDIQHACEPQFLHIQAYYTRRGGMDINPFRSTDPQAQPRPRLNRQ